MPPPLALNRLLRRRVPVPRFHVCAETNPVTGHPYVVMDWVDGARLETVAPGLDGAALAQLGRAVGAVLAGIHGVVFDRMGLFDADLNVVEAFAPGRAGFVAFLGAYLSDGPAAARLGAELARRLVGCAEAAGRDLDAWDGPPCLATAISAARTSWCARQRRAGRSRRCSTGSLPWPQRRFSTSAT